MRHGFCAEIDDDTIELYANATPTRQSIRDHLDTCPRCQAKATEYRSYLSVLRRALHMLQQGGMLAQKEVLRRAKMIPNLFRSLQSKEARMGSILAALSPSEREALFRFYNLEEKASQILQDLGMTENQLRDLRERVRKDFQLSERLQ